MSDKLNKVVVGLCGLVHIGGIIGLARIAYKRNNDAYEEGMKCVELMTENLCKDLEIIKLKQEIDELKSKNEEEA